MRKLMHVAIIFILLFSFVPQSHVVEAQDLPKYKVLFLRDAFTASNVLTQKALDTEINAYKASLATNQSKFSNLEIDFMTVKQFNATRFPMDGAYDAIVFGSSPLKEKYQEALDDVNDIKKAKNKDERSKKHDTTNMLNDLTDLKLGEITDFYVKTGLPVYLHNDVTLGSKNVKQLSALKAFKNVKQFDTDQALIRELVEQQSIRPLLANVDVTYNQKPLVNGTVEVKDNDRKPFQFNYQFVGTPTASTIVELYIDFDHNDRFDPEDKVTEVIASSTTQLEFLLSQPTYTGPKNWMIVAKDTVTGRADYKKGTFLYIDQKVEANILQLTAGTATKGQITQYLSSMLQDDNGQYKFTLNDGTTSEFQKGDFDRQLQANEYDMLIFGFEDSYNKNGSMNVAATSKVKAFAETGQGVMLTHDTIYRVGGGSNATSEWERQFTHAETSKNISGQRIYTNMGLGAPQTTKVIEKVQDGIFTSYPYVLDDAPKAISTTHNQYFTLDLNDPEVTPWYNLSSDKNSPHRSYGDASNHYYTYTKNNFTYSGAGHTNKFDVEDEKKIFINTMYRAFIGSNHKPYNVLESVADETESFDKDDIAAGKVKVSSGQAVKVLWRPGDYDFRDKELTSVVTYNGVSKTYKGVRNYDVQELVIPKDQVVANRPINVTITTTDSRGASVTDRFVIDVKKAADTSKLVNVTRSIDSSTIALYETGTIQYNVEYPQSFDSLSSQKDGEDIRINETLFKETLPNQFEVVSITLPNGEVVRPTDSKKVDLVFNPSLFYEYNGDQNKLVRGETNLQFDVTVRAITPSASLVKWAKEQNELVSKVEKSTNQNWESHLDLSNRFSDLLIGIGAPFAKSASIPNVTLQVGAQQTIVPTIKDELGETFTNPKWSTLKWEILEPSGVATITTSGVNATIRALSPGEKKIRLTIDPGNNRPLITAQSTLRVVSPAESIDIGDQSLYVGQKTVVSPKILPTTAQFESIKIENMSGDSVRYNLTDKRLELEGLKPGETTLKATVVPGSIFSGLQVQSPSTTFKVNVLSPQLIQSPTQLDLWVWNTDEVDEDGVEKRVNETAFIQVDIEPRVVEPFRLIGNVPSALTVTEQDGGFSLRANEGYGKDGVATPITIQSSFENGLLNGVRSNASVVRVNEYPTRIMAKDMTIQVDDAVVPIPSLSFWPTTATWRDYRMNVVSGREIVRIDADGQKMIALKPGVAKIEVFTTLPQGKSFDAIKDTFYVRVIQTNSTGQDDDRY
ncbi:DUF5057 domain-containing protein [Exiguobacterium qingdaonense]|uniref:DUF5057 domain-containing protein n=1 Tax=Exiguobacterium qingdaonense TaxID=2751251 RepID=UPI001BE5F6BF|nr:DUF5057 domain-containing protein [Exiguobacterium qingdaonense]